MWDDKFRDHTAVGTAVTLSFNLAPGVALGQAVEAIQQIEASMGHDRENAIQHQRNLL
jgi:multidrug efflux pump subunit AcrB